MCFIREPPLNAFKPRQPGLLFIVIASLTRLTQTRLIDLRWLSIGAMLIAALISPNVLGTHEILPRLLAFTTLAASLNACLWLASRFHISDRHGIPALTPMLQLHFDLLCWSIFIYLSGGATNPLISVFLPLVAIGAITLERGQAWLLGVSAILFYSFLWRFHLPLPVVDAERATYMHLLGMWLVFGVSTVVSIWFIQSMSGTLRRRDAALAEARERNIEADWLLSLGTQAASAAHEMSTPLATVGLLLEDWQEDAQFPDELRPELQLARRQIDRCRQSLDRLSQRARQTGASGQSAASWLKSFVHAWQANHPATDFRLETLEAQDIQAETFDLASERALGCLLNNALEAGARQILLSTRKHGTALEIVVEDDGCELPEPARTDCLPAELLDTRQSRLAIARATAEQRGGHLHQRGGETGGTRIEFLLPHPPIREKNA